MRYSIEAANVALWPFATFRLTAELVRYRGIADMAELAAGSIRSFVTQLRSQACASRIVERAPRASCQKLNREVKTQALLYVGVRGLGR
jgi:hypothetical protein